jgi:hypothetical protein
MLVNSKERSVQVDNPGNGKQKENPKEHGQKQAK